MKTINPAQIKHILIVKLCCIGDIIQMTPALGALRRHYPQATVDFLCSSWVKETVRRIAGAHDIVIWDEPYQKISPLKKAASFLRLARRLAGRSYDLAFIGHRSPVFSYLAWLAGIPRRAGFSRALSFLTHPAAFHENAYEPHRYLEIVKALGIPPQEAPLEISVLPEDEIILEKLTREHGISWDMPHIAFLPGGGANPGTIMKIKQWDKNNFVELADRLTDSNKNKIILLGGPADLEITAWIAEELRRRRMPVINLAGKTTLGGLIAIFKKCRLIIGHDSGPAYLAAAAGAPVLFLFGPSDPALVAPRGPRLRHIFKKMPCSPCYTPGSVYDKTRFKGKEFICLTGAHACMKEISIAEIEKTAKDMLNAA
ncbi:MAG: glycosyltransferase family 9 protein [Elusimicrobia bacterium]|nr:glycosyltransferase family 9 protein [Elusimicrobiota bacterium]